MANLPFPRLQDIPALRQLALLIGLAGAVALGLWVFNWSQEPGYSPLFAGLDEKDSAEVADALRAAAIPFKLDPISGAVTVPIAQIHEARLKLAARGLPGSSQGGMGSLEGDQGFGVSQFLETARYQRALEIELARTIATLRPVKSARIHLALPKVSAFTRQRDPATASVLLELQPGWSLEGNQVSAIVHLVASSIPDLSAERVTVIDQTGRLLSNSDPTSTAAISAQQFDQQRRLEAVLIQRIQDLLQPLTGPGRVSAQVAVDMDFSVTEQASEKFTPDPAKVRSEQVSEQGVKVADSAQGIPGATSNTPPGPASPAENTSNANTETTRNATRNFELDRTISHVIEPGGRVRRVSVAVLVDHIPNNTPVAASEEEEGESTPAALRALTPDELTRVEALVKEAVGFSATRGDSVSIMNAAFASVDAAAELPVTPIWQQPMVHDIARLVLGAIAVLVLLLNVLRPAVKQLMAPAEPVVVVHRDNPQPMLLAGSNAPPPTDNYEDKLRAARTAVTQDPRRVAQLVKGWVESDA